MEGHTLGNPQQHLEDVRALLRENNELRKQLNSMSTENRELKKGLEVTLVKNAEQKVETSEPDVKTTMTMNRNRKIRINNN